MRLNNHELLYTLFIVPNITFSNSVHQSCMKQYAGNVHVIKLHAGIPKRNFLPCRSIGCILCVSDISEFCVVMLFAHKSRFHKCIMAEATSHFYDLSVYFS